MLTIKEWRTILSLVDKNCPPKILPEIPGLPEGKLVHYQETYPGESEIVGVGWQHGDLVLICQGLEEAVLGEDTLSTPVLFSFTAAFEYDRNVMVIKPGWTEPVPVLTWTTLDRELHQYANDAHPPLRCALVLPPGSPD